MICVSKYMEDHLVCVCFFPLSGSKLQKVTNFFVTNRPFCVVEKQCHICRSTTLYPKILGETENVHI